MLPEWQEEFFSSFQKSTRKPETNRGIMCAKARLINAVTRRRDLKRCYDDEDLDDNNQVDDFDDDCNDDNDGDDDDYYDCHHLITKLLPPSQSPPLCAHDDHDYHDDYDDDHNYDDNYGDDHDNNDYDHGCHLARVHHFFASGGWQTKMNLCTASPVLWLCYIFIFSNT